MNKKRALSYLTALFFLILLGIPINYAKTELETSIISNEVSDDSYEPLPIRTIFHATEKELDLEMWLENIIYLNIVINNDRIWLPVKSVHNTVIRDEEADLPENKLMIEQGTITGLVSDLRNKGLEVQAGKNEQVYVTTINDLITDETICYTISTKKTMNDKINYKYFEQVGINTDEKNLSVEAPFSLENVLDFFYNQSLEDNDFIEEKDLSSKISLREYLKLYKKIVPKKYWPVRHINNSKYFNESIPKLNEDILNIDVEGVDQIYLTRIENEDLTIVKYIITREYEEKKQFVVKDIFTNEVITKSNNLERNI